METQTVQVQLTQEQTNEIARLKTYFPFRIVWARIHQDGTGFEVFASTTRRQMLKSVRDGWIVLQAQ